MQLIHRRIPREFLEMLPEGMKFINRHGQEFLVVEEVTCSQGHSLMNRSVQIHDEPSICIEVHRPGDEKGLIFVDAYWGSHAKLYSFLADPSQPMDYADAFCPHCGVSLLTERSCGNLECGSKKSLELELPGSGNRIFVCARLGCPDHSIVVGKLPHEITEAVDTINFFGHGEDDDGFGGI
jgi:hypothetical protein